MADPTTNLGIAHVQESQSGKHVTINTALDTIDEHVVPIELGAAGPPTILAHKGTVVVDSGGLYWIQTDAGNVDTGWERYRPHTLLTPRFQMTSPEMFPLWSGTSGNFCAITSPNPGTREGKLGFWPLQLREYGQLEAFLALRATTGSITTPKIKFNLYKPHATNRLPHTPYSTSDIQAPITWAAAIVNTYTLRFPLDTAIAWEDLADWMAGDPLVWVACMGEGYYTATPETAPLVRGFDYRWGKMPAISGTVFDRGIRYTSLLADITQAWPTGIGTTAGNFTTDNDFGSCAYGLEFSNPPSY